MEENTFKLGYFVGLLFRGKCAIHYDGQDKDPGAKQIHVKSVGTTMAIDSQPLRAEFERKPGPSQSLRFVLCLSQC